MLDPVSVNSKTSIAIFCAIVEVAFAGKTSFKYLTKTWNFSSKRSACVSSLIICRSKVLTSGQFTL